MEAAIEWLLQTILETLLIDKLDAWIRRVGLVDDIEKLKSEIRRIKIVLSAVKERGIGNELLAESLALLQDHLYDADNVVDDLDYYRLQQQVQGVTIDESEGIHGIERLNESLRGDTDPPNSSVGKLRSMVWEHFTITEKNNEKLVKAKCTYCREEFMCDTKTNGTSSMMKHLKKVHSLTFTKKPSGVHAPNPSSVGEPIVTGSSSRILKGKKRRSEAWGYVDIIENENGKPIKARCKYCPTEIKCGGNGTGSIRNHYKICKKKPGPDDQPSNPSSIADASASVPPTVIGDPSNRKRRADEESPQITAANTHTPSDIVILSSPGDASANATPIVVGDSSIRKRGRVDEESVQITAANTHTPWDSATLSARIRKITCHLQDILEKVSNVLKLHGSNFASNSNHHQRRGSDQDLRTSSLVPRKVYGRVSEKNSIIKMIIEDKSDNIAVVPIVGIAGVGKTALAQLVYNDPDVKKQFDHRIWVWVSRNFDKVRLTTEMINFVSRDRHEGSTHKNERHEGITSFVKLQEILKEHMEYHPSKFLLVLDDVWDSFDDYQWNELLAPLISSDVKGNVILVTTRNVSVAQKIGTLKPVKLRALADDDFWLLFESRAFGDKNCERREMLSIVGRQIAEKLKGNPLAAETAGSLLRKHLSVDHWSNILMNEAWKSLELSRGIMPALKLSYDQLPYHLQQCFSFSSVLPDSYQFLGEELVRIWISQGFVRCNDSSKRLEAMGQFYLTDLVNLGFFQQLGEEEEESSLGSQSSYSICGLMHDFARIVSRNYCATIDGLQCSNILPTIQHLSVVTDSEYSKDRLGNIPRNEKFEEKLRNTVISARRMRTLVLIGKYDSHFFQVFKDKFRTAHNLRLLQMSATSADFNSFMCCLVDHTHLRYVKHKYDGLDGDLPLVLTKFFHLQVLDVGSNNDTSVLDGMKNLVSLRHLVAEEGLYSSIANIGSMTSLQELHDFNVQFRSSGFEMSQLESMNELVQLGVSQLNNVKTREEAYGAGLRNKECLEKLHLSWKDVEKLNSSWWGALSDAEYLSDTSSEPSEHAIHTAREVLEGLEPHMHLKHLHISGYSGTTSPTWLASNISVTSLQTLHLEDCGEWEILPSLEMLPLLTKLKLINMPGVMEVSVPSLEELSLIQMPNLEICSCTSAEGLSSSLRVLQIYECHALEVFNLFEKDKSDIRQRSWLPGLRKLILCDCPLLKVLSPLPPSTTCSELLIRKVSTLPSMKRASSEKLYIGNLDDNDGDDGKYWVDKYSNELEVLDNENFAFHNLGSLKFMRIDGCKNLSSFSFKGFNQLVSLKSLELRRCKELFSSDATHEDVTAENCKAFPSLESLRIESCGMAGKWLSLLLQHAPHLEELYLRDIQARDGLVHIPLNLMLSLKKININGCPHLTFNCSVEVFSRFTSLRELRINACDRLFLSLVHKDGNDDWANGRCLFPTSLEEVEIIWSYSEETLQPCFPSDLTNLRKFKVLGCPTLETLQLRSCMTLEELTIGRCDMLTSLEGLQSLSSLRHFRVSLCPRLVHKDGTVEQDNGRWLLPESLLELEIYSCYKEGLSQETLQPCFSGNLTTLKKLTLRGNPGLKALQLHWCTALEELTIQGCGSLTAVEGLQSLSSLRHLKVSACPPLVHRDVTVEQENGRWLLPKSLRELDINSGYQEELNQERLQPCFPGNLTSLIKLKLLSSNGLKSLQLQSCTALEKLTIRFCGSLTELQGLQSLGSLRHLKVSSCPGLPPFFESFSRQGYELCSPLESLKINDPSVLTKSFCNYLTSLQRLILQHLVLTEEQGRALVLLPSLQELEFCYCYDLVDLPTVLHLLPSLKKLKIEFCRGISRLPETGLPLSLEELEILHCRKELADQCSLLATSKLNVKNCYCTY